MAMGAEEGVFQLSCKWCLAACVGKLEAGWVCRYSPVAGVGRGRGSLAHVNLSLFLVFMVLSECSVFSTI